MDNINEVPFSLSSLRPLGEGFTSRVFLTREDWVVKLAKCPGAFDRMTHEWRVLSCLPELSVQVPDHFGLIAPNDQMRFGGCYYRFIAGRPGSKLTRNTAAQVASILLEIHSVTPSVDLGTAPLVTWNWSDFGACLPRQDISRLEAFFANYSARTRQFGLVHGDFWPENWLENNGKLIGLIDWADSGQGDIAIDFASLAYLSESTLQLVLEHYVAAGGNLRDDFFERLKLCQFRRELMGLRHALANPASGEIADSVTKVRNLVASTRFA